jgi:hypothetical protein
MKLFPDEWLSYKRCSALPNVRLTMRAPGNIPGFERKPMKNMKKLTIVVALLVAALATAGQMRHPSNPLTAGGTLLQTSASDLPIPICPPACDRK